MHSSIINLDRCVSSIMSVFYRMEGTLSPFYRKKNIAERKDDFLYWYVHRRVRSSTSMVRRWIVGPSQQASSIGTAVACGQL